MDLKIGDKFASLEDLELAIKNYEDSVKMTYYRRDSRTLQNARKRGIDIPENSKIKFFSLLWCCSFGGRKYKSRGSGVRPNQRLVQQLLFKLCILLYVNCLLNFSVGIIWYFD